MFSSESVHCENCCEKHHKDGKVTYYHQMLGAVVVHPDQQEVFPLCPEPISKSDGSTKNDCEQNAMKRLLTDFQQEHPHLEVIFTEDALSAKGPYLRRIKEIKNQGYQFEHNFGHGYKHLSHVFGMLMFLAFLVDQVQQRCCGLFQAALKKMGRKIRFWNQLRSLFLEFYVDSWADIFAGMVERRSMRLKDLLNTS
jgi:hypothetical protein